MNTRSPCTMMFQLRVIYWTPLKGKEAKRMLCYDYEHLTQAMGACIKLAKNPNVMRMRIWSLVHDTGTINDGVQHLLRGEGPDPLMKVEDF